MGSCSDEKIKACAPLNGLTFWSSRTPKGAHSKHKKLPSKGFVGGITKIKDGGRHYNLVTSYNIALPQLNFAGQEPANIKRCCVIRKQYRLPERKQNIARIAPPGGPARFRSCEIPPLVCWPAAPPQCRVASDRFEAAQLPGLGILSC